MSSTRRRHPGKAAERQADDVIPNPTRVIVKPIDQPATGRGWVLVRADHDEPCGGGCSTPPWSSGRYCLATPDLGPICATCASTEAPPYLRELTAFANTTSDVLDASPAGWQRDVAQQAISVLQSVLVDHGLA